MTEQYVIIKRDLYYGPNSQGYTGIRDKAGRYSFEEACKIENPEAGVKAIPLSEAPEFTRACYDDLARDHLIKQRDKQAERIEELEEALRDCIKVIEDNPTQRHTNPTRTGAVDKRPKRF